MKKLILSGLAATLVVTSLVPAAYSGPVTVPVETSAWSDPAAANAWSWALIRDGATLDAHLSRDNHALPTSLPVFEMIAAIADPNLAGM